MNQSAIIGGALLAGFALFLTARDKLSTYGRVLWGDKPAAHSAADDASPTAGIIPGTGGFNPLDPLGDYGFSVADEAVKALDGYFKS